MPKRVTVAAGAVAGAAVGTVFATPPGGCEAVVRGSIPYEHCGSTWFKPQFLGTTVQYVVVNPPG